MHILKEVAYGKNLIISILKIKSKRKLRDFFRKYTAYMSKPKHVKEFRMVISKEYVYF